MARLNNPYSAGVFLSLFVNDFEKRNFNIPNSKMQHNPRNNKRTKSKRGKR